MLFILKLHFLGAFNPKFHKYVLYNIPNITMFSHLFKEVLHTFDHIHIDFSIKKIIILIIGFVCEPQYPIYFDKKLYKTV